MTTPVNSHSCHSHSGSRKEHHHHHRHTHLFHKRHPQAHPYYGPSFVSGTHISREIPESWRGKVLNGFLVVRFK